MAFMSTNPNGALGSLDYNKEVRRELAIKSRETAPTYGNSERQMLIDEIHQYLLNKAPPVPQLSPNPTTESNDSTVGEIDAIPDAISATEDLLNQQMEDRVVEAENEADAIAGAGHRSVSSTTELRPGMPTGEVSEQPQRPRVQQSFQDRALTWAAIWLAIAILILLMKKFLKSKIVAESISGF